MLCEVTIAGETVGYVANKDEFESKVNEILNKEEYIGIFYNFIPTSERESNYFNINHDSIISKYKKGYNLKKSKNIIDIAVLSIRFLIGFIDDFISDMQTNLDKKSNKTIVGIKRDPSQATMKKSNREIIKTQIVITSKAENKDREKTLLNSVSNSFKSISNDNELIHKEIKKDIDEYKTTIDNVKVNYATVEEAHNFISIAGGDLIEQYNMIDHNKILERKAPKCLVSMSMCKILNNTTGTCNLFLYSNFNNFILYMYCLYIYFNLFDSKLQ